VPLAIKWSYYTKENVGRESNNYGIYELGNGSGVIYIGEGRIYDRLMCHFAQGSEPCPGASYYRVEYTGGKDRCVQRQNAELDTYRRQSGKYPAYNTRKG